MSARTRLSVLNDLVDTGLVPVLPLDDVDTARHLASACHAGGARLVEFTHRGDGQLAIFGEALDACRRDLPGLAVGIGSVSDAPTAAFACNLGADFVVGPTLDAATARLCHSRKVAYIPGCGTVTEIAEAESFGCEVVKIFPGGALGGPDFAAAVRGPRPWTWLLPTGGVSPTEASVSAWFGAGVVAVGIGSKLLPADEVERGDWDAIAARVGDVIEYARAHSRWREEARS